MTPPPFQSLLSKKKPNCLLSLLHGRHQISFPASKFRVRMAIWFFDNGNPILSGWNSWCLFSSQQLIPYILKSTTFWLHSDYFWLFLTISAWLARGGRVRKSKEIPDSRIFHARTFWIERANCDIVKFLTKVHKTLVLITITLKEKKWICIWQTVS